MLSKESLSPYFPPSYLQYLQIHLLFCGMSLNQTLDGPRLAEKITRRQSTVDGVIDFEV